MNALQMVGAALILTGLAGLAGLAAYTMIRRRADHPRHSHHRSQ